MLVLISREKQYDKVGVCHGILEYLVIISDNYPLAQQSRGGDMGSVPYVCM